MQTIEDINQYIFIFAFVAFLFRFLASLFDSAREVRNLPYKGGNRSKPIWFLQWDYSGKFDKVPFLRNFDAFHLYPFLSKLFHSLSFCVLILAFHSLYLLFDLFAIVVSILHYFIFYQYRNLGIHSWFTRIPEFNIERKMFFIFALILDFAILWAAAYTEITSVYNIFENTNYHMQVR